MTSPMLTRNSANDLLSFNGNELLRFTESHASTSAKKLVLAIEKVATKCNGVNAPLSADWMTKIREQFIIQFCQCFNKEYEITLHCNRPSVLRSVSETDEVFGSTNLSSENILNVDEATSLDTCCHKQYGNGVTYNDNERTFSSMFPPTNPAAFARSRRMSDGDIALGPFPETQTNIQLTHKQKKNKHTLKRVVSFQGGSKSSVSRSDGKDNDSHQSGETSGKGLSWFNRLRRGSLSKTGKVSKPLSV